MNTYHIWRQGTQRICICKDICPDSTRPVIGMVAYDPKSAHQHASLSAKQAENPLMNDVIVYGQACVPKS